MRLALLAAAVLAAVPCAHAASIFFPEMPPTDRCETRDGRPGLCVSATARRCAAFPTLSSLLTLRPRVCRFDAIDPIVCCALSDVLPNTLGQLSSTEAPTQPPTQPTQPPTQPTQPPTQPPTPPPAEPAPTKGSTDAPTAAHTGTPTDLPTDASTAAPTKASTDATTAIPIDAPSTTPTATSTDAPTSAPTDTSSDAPTPSPTEAATDAPTDAPTTAPTAATSEATTVPTISTDAPAVTPKLSTDAPTPTPIDAPTTDPTTASTAAATTAPTVAPSATPTVPTDAPTDAPTNVPTVSTDAPTDAPTTAPTEAPTPASTVAPTDAPTKPTDAPTPTPEASTAAPTTASTNAPTVSTDAPAVSTDAPTTASTAAPTEVSTTASTNAPTVSTDAPVVSTDAPTPAPEASTAASTDASTTASTDASTAASTADSRSCGFTDPERLFLLGSGEYQRELPVAEPPRGVVQVGTAPWTALVGLRTAEGPLAWLCGGALVSERVVLTAAHCAEAGSAHGSLAVRLGEHDLATDTDGATQEFAVQSVRIHPGFQQPAQRDDLALLLLDRPATVTRRVRPVCLPRQGEPLPADTLLVAAAFDLSGELSGAQPTATASGGRLARHSASVAPLRVCREQFEGLPHLGFIFPQGLMESSEVCVVRSQDAQCSHDSGGPLVTAGPGPSRLVGLRLLSGCQQQQPEVALRLDNYVDFIKTTTAEMLEEAKQTSV